MFVEFIHERGPSHPSFNAELFLPVCFSALLPSQVLDVEFAGASFHLGVC